MHIAIQKPEQRTRAIAESAPLRSPYLLHSRVLIRNTKLLFAFRSCLAQAPCRENKQSANASAAGPRAHEAQTSTQTRSSR